MWARWASRPGAGPRRPAASPAPPCRRPLYARSGSARTGSRAPRRARTAARPGTAPRSAGTTPARPSRCGCATAAGPPAPTGCGWRWPAATPCRPQPAPAEWPCGSPTRLRLTPGLTLPQPVDEDVPNRSPLVTVDAARQHVDLLRIEHVDPGRSVGVLVVDLGPQPGGLGWVGGLVRLGLVDLRLDVLLAERGDVRAGVAVRVDGAAAEQHVQEVRGGRVVLEPLRVGHVPLGGVGRVLDERVLDAGRQQLDRGLVADRVDR